MTTLEAAPLLDALDAYRAATDYSDADIAVIVARRFDRKPSTVGRELARIRSEERVTLKYADEIATALDFDINVLYPSGEPDTDEGDDLSDLVPVGNNFTESHANSGIGPSRSVVGNGNGAGHEAVSPIDPISLITANARNTRVRKERTDDLSVLVEYDDDGPSTRERILTYLTQHGGEVRDRKGLLTGHLSEALGCPRATVTDVLMTLDREGVIEREVRATKTYRIWLQRNGQPCNHPGRPMDFSAAEIPKRGRPKLADAAEGSVMDREIEAMRWIVGTLLAFDEKSRARMFTYIGARLEDR